MVATNPSDTPRAFTPPDIAIITHPTGPQAHIARLAWVDVGKGMSILLVVFFHAHLYLAAIGLSNDVFRFVNWAFNPVRMPLFFTISGALAAGILQKPWAELANRKLWVFSALFVIWSTVHVLLFKYLLWHPNGDFDSILPLAVLEGLVRPQTGIWFIWALVFFFAVAKSLHSVPGLAVILSVTAGLFGKTDLMIGWGFSHTQQNILMYMPFFVIPSLYGQQFLRWVSTRPYQLMFIGAVLAVGSKAAPDLLGWQDDGAVFGLLRPTGGLFVGIGLAFVLSQATVSRAVLSYFGKQTLPIYLIHVLLLSAMTSFVTSQNGLPHFALYGVPLVTTVAVAGSLLLARILRGMGANWLLAPLRPTLQARPAP